MARKTEQLTQTHKLKFFQSVHKMVSLIPKGKVMTYGQIATLLGTPDARKVGWALHGNKDPQIPCHRVVNKDGFIAENYAFDGWREQKRRLLDEGVTFKAERQVDLAHHLWQPD